MSGFHEVRFPTGIARGARGGPERLTQVVTLASGREVRNSRWAQSRRRYDAGFGIRTLDALAEVVAFFKERRGRLYGFRWRDRLDWKSCAPSATPAASDQQIGIGDGATRIFQLCKLYGGLHAPYDLVLDRNGQPFELRRAQECELPRELRLVHIDGNNDYRQATARSRRLAGAARRENAVELPMVTRRAEGQRLADQRLQEIWAGRETLELDLSPRCIDLEAGDVVSLEVAGQPRLFRLTRISDGPTRRADARSVEPAIYRGAASGAAETRLPKVTPRIAGRPDALILDLPIVRDTPPPLQSLAAFADPWPGGLAIWRATDGMPFALAGIVEAPSIMGETLTTLRPGPLWRTDRHAFVDVRLRGGGLASVAAEEALAGANALAFIDPAGQVEIVTAARVELIGARTFRLSQMVRGLGGSEVAAARTLADGARVVVLDGAAVALTTSLDDVGRHLRYRIGPPNADVASASMRELSATVGTAALRPLAPVRPRARRLPSGVALSWVRRSRVGGDSWEAVEVPLGEEIERYRVTIRAGDEVIRIIDVGAPTVLYETAQELADFGSAQAALDVELVQLSIVAGVGLSRRGHIAVR